MMNNRNFADKASPSTYHLENLPLLRDGGLEEREANSGDVLVPIDAFANHELETTDKQSEHEFLPFHNNALAVQALDAIPTYIWLYMIQNRMLPLMEIIRLRGVSHRVRESVTQALKFNDNEAVRTQILNYLLQKQDAYLDRKKIKLRKALTLLTASEIVFPLAISSLAASLPMNHFQIVYVYEIKKVVDLIVKQGWFRLNCLSYTIGHGVDSFTYNFTTILPEICNDHSCATLANHVTDGPAGFWFANFIPAAATYVSLRAAFTYTFAENPVKKVVAGAAALASGALTVMMPYFTLPGMPISMAAKYACCSAIGVAENFIYGPGNCCQTFPSYIACDQRGFAENYGDRCFVNTVCETNQFTPDLVGDLSSTESIIPTLAKASTLIFSTFAVSSLLAFSIWRKCKSNSLDKELAKDNLNELRK